MPSNCENNTEFLLTALQSTLAYAKQFPCTLSPIIENLISPLLSGDASANDYTMGADMKDVMERKLICPTKLIQLSMDNGTLIYEPNEGLYYIQTSLSTWIKSLEKDFAREKGIVVPPSEPWILRHVRNKQGEEINPETLASICRKHLTKKKVI